MKIFERTYSHEKSLHYTTRKCSLTRGPSQTLFEPRALERRMFRQKAVCNESVSCTEERTIHLILKLTHGIHQRSPSRRGQPKWTAYGYYRRMSRATNTYFPSRKKLLSNQRPSARWTPRRGSISASEISLKARVGKMARVSDSYPADVHAFERLRASFRTNLVYYGTRCDTWSFNVTWNSVRSKLPP